jgi:hypothetical protein
MSWQRLNLDRLAKVLALASSDRDGEALSALRKAERMLTEVGLGMVDLADTIRRFDPVAPKPAPAPEPEPQPKAEPEPPRPDVEQLTKRLDALHEQLNEAAAAAAFNASEADRWRDICWDAARYICSLEVELSRLRAAAGEAPRPASDLEIAGMNGRAY